MNEENLKLLHKNNYFTDLVPQLPSSLTNLSRDLCNFGSFLDNNDDIRIGKCYIEKNKTLKEYLEIMDYTNNAQPEPKKPKTNTIKLVSILNILIYPIQSKITEIIQNLDYSLEILDIHNYKYGDNLFYILLVSLYPNFHNFTNDKKTQYIDIFCKELSFNISKRGTLKKYNYKGIISENNLQNTLLDQKERFSLSYSTLSSFLADYFNINIVVIINHLVIETLHHDPERLSLLMFYKNDKYSIGTNNYLTNLFPPSVLKKIYTDINELLVINKLQSCSKYKLKDIQDIALKLDISIDQTINDKIKKKTKNSLYDEIVQLVPR